MSPRKPQTQIQPLQLDQPELFTEVAGMLVPSEVATSDQEFAAGALAAIRQALTIPTRELTYAERMDILRRDRVSAERETFLAEHPEETGDSIGDQDAPKVETVVEKVVPMVLQGTLAVGVESASKPEGRKVAFGRYLKEGIYNLAGDVISYDLTTQQERHMMTPKGLRGILMPPKEEVGEKDLVVDGLLLNQVEYVMLPRSPKHLARSSAARVYGHKDVTEDPEVHERAERGVGKTFKSKQESMIELREGMTQRLGDIERLIKLSRNPGFAQETPEELKRMLGSAWMEFDNILNTLAVKFQWDVEHIQAAKSAFLGNITRGSQNTRTHNFASMLGFARSYLNRRVQLFNRRIKASDKYIALLPSVEVLPDDSEIA